MHEINKDKRTVRYSDIYEAFVGTCPAFFRGIVSQDQDEFVATKELIKAIKFKMKSMKEEGEPLPAFDNSSYKMIRSDEPVSHFDLCPTCGQKVISFVDYKDYSNALREGLDNHK